MCLVNLYFCQSSSHVKDLGSEENKVCGVAWFIHIKYTLSKKCVVPTYKNNIQEAETGELGIGSQSELHSNICYKKG